MGWADHIHSVRFDDRVVILDTMADRYRLLGARQSATVADLESGADIQDRPAFDAMVRQGLLVPDGRPFTPISTIAPVRSVHASGGASDRAITAGVTMRAVVGAALRVRWTPFDKLLVWARAAGTQNECADDIDRTIAAARSYDHHRSSLPLARICLRDALALHHVLARRRLSSQLVFGVRLDPFGAHCWVQAGDVLLSDHLDPVRQMKPILAL